jgi:predicted RNA-binding protein with PUA-like domain
VGYFILKQNPASYSWDDLVSAGVTSWTGIRNGRARDNLKKMKRGDKVLFYHSGSEKAVVGLAEVTRESYRDLTSKNDQWVAVDLKPLKAIGIPVKLESLEKSFSPPGVDELRQSRTVVLPISKTTFETIVSMGDVTKLLEESVKKQKKSKGKR